MKTISATVAVQIRNSYGVDRIYPMNATAQLLCKLTGRKTLYEADLKVLMELGYEVEWVPQTLHGEPA